jgi:hypothetical protein
MLARRFPVRIEHAVMAALELKEVRRARPGS